MGRNIVLCVAVVAATSMLAAIIHRRTSVDAGKIVVSETMSLKDIAKENGVPLKKILHVMGHKDRKVWDLPKGKPIGKLKVDVKQVEHALEHVKGESDPLVQAGTYVLWSLWVTPILLFVLTRKKTWRIRVVVLVLAVLVFGAALGATPNPMESVVKLFKAVNKMEARPIMTILVFLIFSLLSVMGAKLLCSWGCPLGALQDLVNKIREAVSKGR